MRLRFFYILCESWGDGRLSAVPNPARGIARGAARAVPEPASSPAVRCMSRTCAVVLIVHEYRIGHFPIHDSALEFLRQEEARHIDDQVEFRACPGVAELLGKWSRRSMFFSSMARMVSGATPSPAPGPRWPQSSRRCRRCARSPPPSGCGRNCRCRRTARASSPRESQLLQEQTGALANPRSARDGRSPPGAGPARPAPGRPRIAPAPWIPSPTRRMIGARMNTASSLPGRGALLEFGFGIEFRHAAVDLPAVGVALHLDIHQPQALLRRIASRRWPSGSRRRRCRTSACAGRTPPASSNRFS